MNVSFSIGSKSRAITNTLKTSADNIDFYTSASMKDLIKEATLRHISYDRIVFSSEILSKDDPESDLRALYEFIQNYSNQTELVFIVKGEVKGEEGLDKVFSEMFNSPMYTPVIMRKANAQTLLEIVRDDITELKARYYTLVEKEDRVLVSEAGEQKPKQQEVVNAPVYKKKKGFFKRVFGGGSKKESNSSQVANVQKNTYEGGSSAEKMAAENVHPFSAGPEAFGASLAGENDINSSVSENQQKNIFEVSEGGASSIEAEGLDSGFPTILDEDEMLGIGKFGESHSDTGFLDSSDEEELRRYSEARDSASVEKREVEDSGLDSWEEGVSEEPVNGNDANTNSFEEFESFEESSTCDKVDESNKKEEEVKKPIKRSVHAKDKKTYIDLVVGVKGSGATQEIVDEAIRMVEEDNLKVLIVDLDTKENGLLSYIDTEKFYNEGANSGISKMRIYSEDGVDVVSNGYGVPLSNRVLANFLSSRIVRKYDTIFLDCPADNLDLFDSSLIVKCNVIVITGNDRSDLVSTTLALTNREVVCYDVERYICDNCTVEVLGGELAQEDIDWLDSMCLFANGNWLLRIGE